jgi:hypothetical protein
MCVNLPPPATNVTATKSTSAQGAPGLRGLEERTIERAFSRRRSGAHPDVRDRAVKWLAETKTDADPQALAMRLVLWKRLGRPAEEWRPLVRRIKARQHADGGWSQTREMASDAWATGQALYALAHAGVKPGAPVIRRAHAFLIRTQRDDGSWPMTSCPVKPGGEGSNNLIPIVGAGSAWAVLGLGRVWKYQG